MLLRKYIILQSKQDAILKYDYNYELCKLIYQKIALYDKEFSELLHNEGYRSKDKKHKKLKLFNFSLEFKDAEMKKDGIVIHKNNEVSLIISGYDKIVKSLISGISIENKFNIDNILFEVVDVKNDDFVRFNPINIYKTVSPVVESIRENNRIEYINPYNPKYYQAIKQNLYRKYEVIYDKPYTGELKIMIEDILKVKRKTISIKDGGYLQGYGRYEMLVQCDKDMQQIAYYCGLGQNNSMGAGFLKYITGGQ